MNLNPKIAITICATEKHSYALSAQARRVQSNVKDIKGGFIILVGDFNPKFEKTALLYKELMPAWEVIKVQNTINDDNKGYRPQSMLLIAQLRTLAFNKARSLDIDYCWSLDSDVLPPDNALSCMLSMIQFDNGYYSVATCPYPSQGGAGFLGGRGTPHKQILEDWYEDERKIPKKLADELLDVRKRIKKNGWPTSRKEALALDKLLERRVKLEEEVKKYPPKDNVFALNARGWRRRGWLEQAYPAVGRGAVVPSDWCGFGCALINREALGAVHFEGYEGKGTEDLYVVWNCWYPKGMRICVIPHCLCSHVIRNPGYVQGKNSQYILCHAYHETEGECIGHIRMKYKPFYSFEIGEKFDPNNKGVLIYQAENTVKIPDANDAPPSPPSEVAKDANGEA